MTKEQVVEGATPLDPNELAGLNFPHVSTREELDQLEQVNVQDGLVWLSRYKKSDILSESFIRTLHKQLFGEVWQWAGSYRLTEKNIGVLPHQIIMQLHDLLDDTQFWVEHRTYPAIELAARFHHRLVQIHPFSNGNGRHARIMADAVLTKILKQPPINWRGSELQKMSERRKAYINALRAADKGNYELLLSFVKS